MRRAAQQEALHAQLLAASRHQEEAGQGAMAELHAQRAELEAQVGRPAPVGSHLRT